MRRMIHPERIFGSRSAFFFQKFQKKKKKLKKFFFFQNRFKNIMTFPKRHADNFLEIFPIVKTPYVFWSWICLWRFFDTIWEQECFFREQECFFFSKIKKKKKKKKNKKNIFFFQNRFKKVITFPKRLADKFLEISPMVKTSYAFWSWICLGRFFEKIRKFPVRKKKISAGDRNFGRRPKSLPKAGILSHLPKKSILSGGPSRRQLYPSRWYRFFFFKKKAVAYRSLNL